jgi:ABC-2 type transport system ATP-binding protein
VRIELRGVSKRFGRVTALDDLSLDIPAGSRVALIGPNGSGKSTLTRVLMGIHAAEGVVLLGGQEPAAWRREREGRLAYVPQVAPQLGAGVGEVVASIEAIRALEPGRVAELAARLGLDVDAVAGKPFRALSGGMKQKLLIALALAPESSLLILDEPTASLDAAARQVFYALVGERAGSATLLLCSHRLEEVRHLVDHVVGLEEGRLAFDGPVAAYLSARSHAVVEVRLRGSAHEPWLRACGFLNGAGSGWVRTVSRAGKTGLVRQLLFVLKDDLEDLVVRDLDAVEDPGSTGAPAQARGTEDPESSFREGTA